MAKLVAAALAAAIMSGVSSAQEHFPLITGAGGTFSLPHAAVQADPAREYKAIFQATRPADRPGDVIPALDDAAALMNGLALGGVPAGHRHITVVLYGAAAYAALNNATYRDKYGVDNPNVGVISELRTAGVEMFICGQWLRDKQIEDSQVLPTVSVAADAFIALVSYQNQGYALMGD